MPFPKPTLAAPSDISSLPSISTATGVHQQMLNIAKVCSQKAVSLQQYLMLFSLAQQDGITMTDIAKVMGHTTAAATGLVDRVARMGFVTRATDEGDRRKIRVHMSPAGRDFVRWVGENAAKEGV